MSAGRSKLHNIGRAAGSRSLLPCSLQQPMQVSLWCYRGKFKRNGLVAKHRSRGIENNMSNSVHSLSPTHHIIKRRCLEWCFANAVCRTNTIALARARLKTVRLTVTGRAFAAVSVNIVVCQCIPVTKEATMMRTIDSLVHWVPSHCHSRK
jgi:hypothetical protein